MHWNPAVGIPLLVLGALALVLIYLFGRPGRPGQGERRGPRRRGSERVEPTLDGAGEAGAEQEQLAMPLDGGAPDAPARPPRPAVGVRPDRPIERIVTWYVAARAGEMLAGTDVVVAAEKAGLQFGDMGIFHRIQDGKPELGPIFSVANMIKPGSFDMARVAALETPGLSFFMTLPGPIPALDAWDTMLPTAQRLGELLDGLVLDEDRNALGRQRIAYIRDDLRGWDRRHEGEEIPFGR
jgi:cell division protein ZipA